MPWQGTMVLDTVHTILVSFQLAWQATSLAATLSLPVYGIKPDIEFHSGIQGSFEELLPPLNLSLTCTVLRKIGRKTPPRHGLKFRPFSWSPS